MLVLVRCLLQVTIEGGRSIERMRGEKEDMREIGGKMKHEWHGTFIGLRDMKVQESQYPFHWRRLSFEACVDLGRLEQVKQYTPALRIDRLGKGDIALMKKLVDLRRMKVLES
jgi:hypothetical protein